MEPDSDPGIIGSLAPSLACFNEPPSLLQQNEHKGPEDEEIHRILSNGQMSHFDPLSRCVHDADDMT